MTEKGSQPQARTPEQRRKNLEAVKRYYARKRDGVELEREDGPQLMGIVPPLAFGAINPMWAMEESIESLLDAMKQVKMIPLQYRKQRFKKVPLSGKTGFYNKLVEIEDDDDEVIEPIEEEKK